MSKEKILKLMNFTLAVIVGVMIGTIAFILLELYRPIY